MSALNLTPGQMYQIHTRTQAANYRWVEREMRAKYLGYDAGRREYEFSFRPLAGTSGIPLRDIAVIQPSDDEQPMLPRKARLTGGR